MTQSNLTRDEARERARLLSDLAYEVSLDLAEDDEETFRSETRLRFRCAEPGGSTFADFTARSIESIELNGRTIDLAAHDGTRLRLEGLGAENELRVAARFGYRQDGTGMTRFVDPVDDAVYVYSDLEPMDAHKAFACFDQPDLKGTFAFTVRAPEAWTVLSNMAPQAEAEPQGTTPACGGSGDAGDPHLHHRGGGGAAASRPGRERATSSWACTAAPRSASTWTREEILEITRRASSSSRRPSTTPIRSGPSTTRSSCPTTWRAPWRTRAASRSTSTTSSARARPRSVHERRADTILHEMAHMWFGDLVTMRWWNDLWLNESFASYASVLAVRRRRPGSREGWTTFAETEKTGRTGRTSSPPRTPSSRRSPTSSRCT